MNWKSSARGDQFYRRMEDHDDLNWRSRFSKYKISMHFLIFRIKFYKLEEIEISEPTRIISARKYTF